MICAPRVSKHTSTHSHTRTPTRILPHSCQHTHLEWAMCVLLAKLNSVCIALIFILIYIMQTIELCNSVPLCVCVCVACNKCRCVLNASYIEALIEHSHVDCNLAAPHLLTRTQTLARTLPASICACVCVCVFVACVYV